MLAAQLHAARSLGLALPRRRIPLTRRPTLIESDYAARLVGIVGRMRTTTHQVLATWSYMHRSMRADDHPGAEARHKVEQIRAEVDHGFDPHSAEHMIGEFGRRVSDHQREQITRQAKAALGVDVQFRDQKLAQIVPGFVHENVSLIRKLQGDTLGHLEALLTRAVASGTRSEAVAAEIEARFGVSERHARLIARDQIGKVNGQITEARHLELGVRSYRWRTMRDPKVRPTHKPLEGLVFAYAKPPAEGNPGQPICCRCLGEPVFDDIYAELDALGV